MISIPIIKTLFNDGLNSSGSASRYRRAIGGPPIAAIIPKIPENVPAMKELVLFLLITHPKYDATPPMKTMNPTERDKYLVLKFSNSRVPIGPPTNLPSKRGLTSFRLTFSFSLKKTLIASGKASKESNCGTKSALIWTTIGEDITAKPKPKTPWIAELK